MRKVLILLFIPLFMSLSVAVKAENSETSGTKCEAVKGNLEVTGSIGDKNQLVIVDGEVLYCEEDIKKIDPNEIESMSVLKRKLTNGVIIVKSKVTPEPDSKFSFDEESDKPLILINNVPTYDTNLLKDIEPELVESINVHKDPINAIILITTKNKQEK